MSDLVLPIKDGQVVGENNNTVQKKPTRGNSDLGKEQFLQLLVTQMKYQDPLSPTDNTQFVEQLATFSQLEQMQNLNATTINTQAFALVDKEVIMKTKSADGKETLIQGTVDYVTTKGTKTYLSIEDKLYSIDDLYTVIGDNYLISQKVPSVPEQTFEYDHKKPEDIIVNVSLGKDEFEASAVVVLLDGEVINSKYLSYEDGKVTINKEAFAATNAGLHTLAFVFNDPLTTTVTDKVAIKITGDKQMEELPKDEEDGEEGEGGEVGDGGDGGEEPPETSKIV